MDKETRIFVIVAVTAIFSGALLCGLMCLSAYHAHCRTSMHMHP